MDAVSDRDFLIEFHSAASILMMHVSRMSEEVILWSSREFGFISLSDEFTTGSSIMPRREIRILLNWPEARPVGYTEILWEY
ncbi:MAG: hypothetical protein CM1200mP15_14000 [Dehalococcoidia bacterium]|nr:MAG: hypothetical protein CM1200mP15_14000 [Dehalococcoidia bacterium]